MNMGGQIHSLVTLPPGGKSHRCPLGAGQCRCVAGQTLSRREKFFTSCRSSVAQYEMSLTFATGVTCWYPPNSSQNQCVLLIHCQQLTVVVRTAELGSKQKAAFGTLSAVLTGVLTSPWPDQEGNKLRSMSRTRAISTTSRRELSSSAPPPTPQGKAPKEIHAILTETLACFLPRRAKDLSPPM